MATPNLFKNLKPDTKLSHNGFDWSGRDVLSFQLGALYPVWNKSLIPSEKVRININHILRSFPMSAPNFNRNRAHFEFFFVPYSQIWKPWNELYLGRGDKQRVTDGTPITSVPSFRPYIFKRELVDDLASSRPATDIHGYRIADNAFRLMDLLGYGSVMGYENKFAQFVPEGESLADVADTIKATFGRVNDQTYLNVFKIAAYQKIWASYYRDSIHDTNDYRDVFNFDDCTLDGANDVTLTRDREPGNWFLSELFTQRYRSYKKDLITGSYPSQQFGDVSSVSFTNIRISGSDDPLEPNAPLGMQSNLNVSYQNDDEQPSTLFHINNAFDVYQFYRAEAVQLWRERVMRAGNRYKDNYKAHFGVVPKFLEDDYPEFVGSFSTLIGVDDVVSTAETSEGSLGALAGKGIAVDQTGNIEYECRDFGILMCMLSVVPEMDYNATGFDKDNMALVPEDFIIPEFDRVGLEPICVKEFTTQQPACPVSWAASTDFDNKIFGHNPRFYNHKARLNKVHGRFQYNIASQYNESGVGPNYGLYNGDLSIFVQARQMNLWRTNVFTLSDHYINPNVSDPMFSINSDGTEATDRFFGAIQVNCESIQPLSVLGVHAI